jgi:hypothetical protein
MNLNVQDAHRRSVRLDVRAPVSAASLHETWLHEVSARFCAAITLRVPVGFEDETGFHRSPPPAPENLLTVASPNPNF